MGVWGFGLSPDSATAVRLQCKQAFDSDTLLELVGRAAKWVWHLMHEACSVRNPKRHIHRLPAQICFLSDSRSGLLSCGLVLKHSVMTWQVVDVDEAGKTVFLASWPAIGSPVLVLRRYSGFWHCFADSRVSGKCCPSPNTTWLRFGNVRAVATTPLRTPSSLDRTTRSSVRTSW